MGKAFLYGQSGGGAPPKFPEYTGDHTIYGDAKKGYMIMTGSGDLSFPATMNVDVFLVGGGGGGGRGQMASGTENNQYYGGAGGGGGYAETFYSVLCVVNQSHPITIGAGGAPSSTISVNTQGGTTTFGAGDTLAYGGTFNGGSGGGQGAWSEYSYVGTNGGSGGSDGSNGNPGGSGQGTTTRPFGGDVAPLNAVLFSGGGGGGAAASSDRHNSSGSGGAGGGASGANSQVVGSSALPNTGGGGGGGACINASVGTLGGSGGSGICIIRWGDWTEGM